MALTNHDRVGKALDQLAAGLQPFIERELKAVLGERWQDAAKEGTADCRGPAKPINWADPQTLLGVMWNQWNAVFGRTPGAAERSLVSELHEGAQPVGARRHSWATTPTGPSTAWAGCCPPCRPRRPPRSSRCAWICCVSVRRAAACGDAQGVVPADGGPAAGRAEAVARGRRRRTPTWPPAATSRRSSPPTCGRSTRRKAPTSTAPDGVLPPHLPDGGAAATADTRAAAAGRPGRRSGRRAADEFRRRQNALDAGAVPPLFGDSGCGPARRRGAGSGGRRRCRRPCVASSWWATRYRQASRSRSRTARWCAPVGRAGLAARRQGRIRLWSREADETATNPGDALTGLFNKYAPCLVLIDEWVAYARQARTRRRTCPEARSTRSSPSPRR